MSMKSTLWAFGVLSIVFSIPAICMVLGQYLKFQIKGEFTMSNRNDTIFQDGWLFCFELVDADELTEEMINELAEENKNDD